MKKLYVAFLCNLLFVGCGREDQCKYADDTQHFATIHDEDGAEIGRCYFPAGPMVTNRRSYGIGDHHGLASGIVMEPALGYTIRVSQQ